MSKFIILCFCLLGLFAGLLAQQTAGEIFQEALYLEEAEGDLEKAIRLYRKILDQFPEEREVTVKAQLHIGICYEKLGLKEAREAFEKVVENFPDQKEEVEIARQRLARLVKAKAVLEETRTELTMQKMFTGVNRDFVGEPSPDGRYLSTVDWTTGDLAVREIASGKLRRLTNKPNWAESAEYALKSVWSPDGKKLAYSWMNKEGYLELRVIGLDGSEPQVLYRDKRYFMVIPADWAPDGKHVLAGIGEKQRVTRIAAISIQDGEVRDLREGLVNPGFYLPDGRTIIYSVVTEIQDSIGEDIAMLPAEGGEPVLLVEHPAQDMPLTWDARGERLLFMSNRTGTMDIWALKMKKDGTREEPYLLKKDMGRIDPLGFTDSGDLYYVQYAGVNDVYTAVLDPQTNSFSTPAERVTKLFIGANRSPDFSPDGGSLAYVSERSYGPGRFPRPVICIQSLETGETRELVTDLRHMGFIRWSVDGQYFYSFGFDGKGRSGLFSIDGRTGKSDFLLSREEGEPILELDVLPDGQRVVCKMWEQGKGGEAHRMSIRIRNIQSGEEEEIYRRENASRANHMAVSSDGKRVVFDDRVPHLALMVVESAGGEAEEICRMKPGESIVSLAWRPESREIYFVKGGNPNQLWRVSFEDREPRRTNLSMRSMRELEFHPGGTRLAFYSGYVEAEFWMMENLLRLERSKKIFR